MNSIPRAPPLQRLPLGARNSWPEGKTSRVSSPGRLAASVDSSSIDMLAGLSK
jgi:hypothetical protein